MGNDGIWLQALQGLLRTSFPALRPESRPGKTGRAAVDGS